MIKADRLAQIAHFEGIGYGTVNDFDQQVDRLFGENLKAGYDLRIPAHGLWHVNYRPLEAGVEAVRFTKAVAINLRELEASQMLMNRVYVGLGQRSVRTTTRTTAVIKTSNKQKAKAYKGKNEVEIIGYNAVTVAPDFVVDPALLSFTESTRAEHVAQILTGATTLLRSIE